MQADPIGHVGSNRSVVNAARVRFQKELDAFDEAVESRLVDCLAQKGHLMPFAPPGVATGRYNLSAAKAAVRESSTTRLLGRSSPASAVYCCRVASYQCRAPRNGAIAGVSTRPSNRLHCEAWRRPPFQGHSTILDAVSTAIENSMCLATQTAHIGCKRSGYEAEGACGRRQRLRPCARCRSANECIRHGRARGVRLISGVGTGGGEGDRPVALT